MVQINKQLNAAQPRSFLAIDDAGRRRHPNELIFPLATITNGQVHIIGTGFFITKFGLFVTARHVLEEVLDENMQAIAPLRALQFFPDGGMIYRKVIGGTVNNEADVAIGCCENLTFTATGEPMRSPILSMTTRAPEIGEVVVTYAYPGATVMGGNIMLRPNYYAGTIRKYYESGRDRIMLPNPCYETSITIHGGASGGPVFDRHGEVFGVNSTGVDGMPDVSFVSRIKEALSLNVMADHLVFPDPDNRTVTELARLKMTSIVLDTDHS